MVAVASTFRVLFLPFLERLLMVGRANCQTRCLPSLSAIAAVALLYVVIFSPQDRRLFGVVQVPARVACSVCLGRNCFGGMVAKWGASPRMPDVVLAR